MHVLSSQGQQFFREYERYEPNDEPMAVRTNDEPLDDAPNKPIHAKSLEYSGKSTSKPKPAIKTRRGYGRKNRNKNGSINVNFSLLGANSAGINPKKESLFSVMNKYRPSAITLQETKLSKPGMIKLTGYQILNIFLYICSQI